MVLLSLLIVISFVSLFVGLMMLIITSTLGLWAKVTLLSALVLVYSIFLFKASENL
jgi:hypothetical protein